MRRPDRDTLIAIAVLAFSLLALLVWIPLDIESGVLEKHRRTVYIGDAMLPTLCAALMLLACALRLIGRLFTRSQSATHDQPAVTGFLFQIKILIIIAIALVVMFYLGSAVLWVAAVAGFELGNYRELRDTVPWKYLGFIVGGTLMVTGLISLIENRLRLRNAGFALLACLILILLFDLPFDDLLLPPNGDY